MLDILHYSFVFNPFGLSYIIYFWKENIFIGFKILKVWKSEYTVKTLPATFVPQTLRDSFYRYLVLPSPCDILFYKYLMLSVSLELIYPHM